MAIASQRHLILAGIALPLLVIALPIKAVGTMQTMDPSQSSETFTRVDSLGLPQETTLKLRQDLESKDYVAAEKLLLEEIQLDPHSKEAGRLLSFAGGVYFLNHDYLNAAIAWNKADAITPLDSLVKFSLAMAYIRIGHPDWARKTLAALARQDAGNTLYPYWLGRLDYDEHAYEGAIREFQQAIQLAPKMALAYNNLGLCYYYLNLNSLAIENYQKAIDLDRGLPHPSAWPYLNLAITLHFLGRLAEAEAKLRKAIELDSNIAPAHFELGNVLEQMGHTDAAVDEFRTAARLDPTYAEPHYALARLYRRLGENAAAQKEVEIYRRLHSSANNRSSSTNPSY